MTRRLILMRHAKSDWSSLGLRDYDRPLNKRGKYSANAVGKWLKEQNYIPDEILCSSARRTVDTCAGLNLETKVNYLPALYHASEDQMLRLIKNATGHSVLMVGHNPGIAFLAHMLMATPPAHDRFDDYPTCATLVADFPINTWADLTIHSGETVNFTIPREL